MQQHAITSIDCGVFLLLLIPNLLRNVAFLELTLFSAQCLPFLLLELPAKTAWHRVVRPHDEPFYDGLFQEVVFRCVKYCFRCMPCKFGRVFFSKEVAMPFWRYRFWAHEGQTPFTWTEVNQESLRGLWMYKEEKEHHVIVYFVHGGGFSMGSPYFYLEFLLALLEALTDAGFANPAVFAIDYDLVPDSTYPTQTAQVLQGYRFVRERCLPENIVLSGDSAGATLVLGLLFLMRHMGMQTSAAVGSAVLISPWMTLRSPAFRDTATDILDKSSLERYGRQYIGGRREEKSDYIMNPGLCEDKQVWMDILPKNGMDVVYGGEEVFAPDIERVVGMYGGSSISLHREERQVHAWPVAMLFLGSNETQRTRGVQLLAASIKRHQAQDGKRPIV